MTTATNLLDQPVKVTVTYYKESGKYAYEGHHETRQPASYLVVDELIDRLIAGDLPGVSCKSWEGVIHIDMADHPMGVPHVLPKGTTDLVELRERRNSYKPLKVA